MSIQWVAAHLGYLLPMPLSGEQIQQRGASGAQLAKRWLEATCRAEVKWNNPGGLQQLQYSKASASAGSTSQGDHFSFDLGGTLVGEEYDGDIFLGEVKYYSGDQDQGTEFRSFVAKAYRVEVLRPGFCNHYLWITWAPFLVTMWGSLCTAAFVEDALRTPGNKTIACGDDHPDPIVCTSVAEKLRIVVLSDSQIDILTLRGAELAHVRKALLDLRTT